MAVNNLLSMISFRLQKRVSLHGFRGFTLAEVLITLVIIGVIASMTIPTLMNNTNKQEYVSKLKKTYSTFAQATNRIISEQGMPRGDIGGWATDSDNVAALYKKHLSNAKECLNGQGCFENVVYKNLNGSNFKNLDADSNANYRKFILADGTSVLIGRVTQSCGQNWDGKSDDCFQIYVDINGAKKPNKAGHDLYSFVVKSDGLHPRGCDVADCTTHKGADNVTGADCTCRVLREGAINY